MTKSKIKMSQEIPISNFKCEFKLERVPENPGNCSEICYWDFDIPLSFVLWILSFKFFLSGLPSAINQSSVFGLCSSVLYRG
jgi:hypothetical protein